MPLSISLRDDVAELLNVPVVLLFFFFPRLEFDDVMREIMLSNLNDKTDDIYNNDHQINHIAECSKNTSKNKKNNFDGIDEMMDDDRQEQNIESDNQQEQEVDDTSFSVDEDEALDYTIEVEEFAFEHHDYNLHASKPDQTSSID
ncbi:12523_t:CDS:2, partial [Funneliformis caledonium]